MFGLEITTKPRLDVNETYSLMRCVVREMALGKTGISAFFALHLCMFLQTRIRYKIITDGA